MKHILIFLAVILTLSCKVKAQKAEFRIACNEMKKLDSEDSDLEIIKTCAFNNYLFKSIGVPDYKGRYSYSYEIAQIKNKDTLKIFNSDFFNDKANELEMIINDKLKAKYESDSEIPEINECMLWIDFRYYNLNEFGISFSETNQMEFNINYEIGSACFNVSSSSVVMELSEIEKYLK